MNVEIVVTGALGDLAIRAFADLAVERRQVLVTSAPDTFDALDRLTARGVEVLVVRERQAPGGPGHHPSVSGEAPSSRAVETERAGYLRPEAEFDTGKARIFDP